MNASCSKLVRGFSLLELLVALSIMSLALGMLYQSSTGAMRGVGDLDTDLRASLLAQSMLESRDAVPEGGWNDSGVAAGMNWQVSSAAFETSVGRSSPTVPRLHEVRVLVEWAGRLGPRRIELQTLLPQQRAVPGSTRR